MRRTYLLVSLLSFILCLLLVVASFSFAGNQTATFAWQQNAADLPKLGGWNMFKSDIPGGPYTFLATIHYNGTAQQEYTSDQVLTSPDGQIKTYYFVLTAWDKAGNDSAYSNEASVTIDFKPISVPIQFRITVKPQ